MSKRKPTTEDQWCSRGKPSSLTSDFDLSSSCFSGSSINYQTPCTSTEGRPCDIFRDLTVWNEVFRQVDLELQELSPGQLSLVKMGCPCILSHTPRQEHEAATLLHFLLIHHRCLVSVVLNEHRNASHMSWWASVPDRCQLICDALPKSPNLRKLELHLFAINMRALQSLTAALPFMNNLLELDCQIWHCECLSELLVSTASLKTLKLSARKMEAENGVVLFHGLKRNKTVTTLSLDVPLSAFVGQHDAVFADYLCENQTLRSLTVTSKGDYVPTLIIRSLFSTTTISEVRLNNFWLDNENSRLVAEMLCENRSLRAFHMGSCHLYVRGSIPESDGVSDRIYPWITALAKNTTLERLTMDLSCFDPEEFRSLLKALASNKSLKITASKYCPPIAESFRVLRETGLHERFFLDALYKVEEPFVTLTECKELSRIHFNSMVHGGFDPVHTALSLLPTCSHVTSLILWVGYQWFDDDAISLMATYVADTTVLRHLHVGIDDFQSPDIVARFGRALVQALSSNESVRKLFLVGFYLDDTESQMLVDKLQASRTLYELSLCEEECRSLAPVIQKLSPRVSSNYTLLAVGVLKVVVPPGELLAVNDVVCRNVSLVTRAAHFVTGRRDRYCAAAAELVHWHPGLAEKVQELASVDENEALSRIQKSLGSFSELDDFMCVAGVVKYGVACHGRDDGQMQLTDLNRDCWLYVRLYLKMGDILDAQ